jgi:hypothetical protein
MTEGVLPAKLLGVEANVTAAAREDQLAVRGDVDGIAGLT